MKIYYKLTAFDLRWRYIVCYAIYANSSLLFGELIIFIFFLLDEHFVIKYVIVLFDRLSVCFNLNNIN